MKNMLRKLGLSVIMLVLMLALAGCSGDKNGDIQTSLDAEINKNTQTDTQKNTEVATEDTSTQETEETQETETTKPNPNAGQESTDGLGFTVLDPNNTRGLATQSIGFGIGASSGQKPHSSILGAQKSIEQYKNVDALVYDANTDEKIIYLTFDCGYEHNGNAAKILDILKEKKVKAAFFGLLSFYKNNPETTKRMIDEGHIVGNHSVSHPIMPTLSRTQMAKELYGVHKYLLDNYGYTSSYFRPPTGAYSESMLDLCTSVGYKTILWSLAYVDWETDNQPAKDYALKTVSERIFPGVVILLHTVSDTNVAILGDFIDYAKAQGYKFVTLDSYDWD